MEQGNINGYKIIKKIGQGSFGQVYKVTKNDSVYALKLIRKDISKDTPERFLREVKAMQIIEHSNVVKIRDYGEFHSDHDFDYIYIVMDFIDGRPLSELVGKLEVEKAKQIIISVLETMAAVHKQAVIHRDLKPSNIIIDQDAGPIILDLGLAKLIDYTSITPSGALLGTYRYMAPEQIDNSKYVNELSDYYSIGVIFYELLSGRHPYDADTLPELIDMIKHQPPTRLTKYNLDVPSHIETVVLNWMLEKAPADRYQSVEEIIDALNQEEKPRQSLLAIEPRNYWRLLHTEKTVFLKGVKAGLIQDIVFPANFFQGYRPTVDQIRQSSVRGYTTDPATNRLAYTSFSATKGLLNMPYSPQSSVKPLDQDDFKSSSEIRKHVKKVIDYQVKYGVNQLMAPFFYAKDPSDPWFDTNIHLLGESIDYRDENYPDTPIIGSICMYIDKWHKNTEKQDILNQYVRLKPDAYFAYGDPVGKKSNSTQLFHYADLLLKLQEKSQRPVIASRINGFGLILMAFGLSGMSSGIASLDSFSESTISSGEVGYSLGPRYYMPGLMHMFSSKEHNLIKDVLASDIGRRLKCTCKYCQHPKGQLLGPENFRMHFLTKRQQEIQMIAANDTATNIHQIEGRLGQAMTDIQQLKRAGILIRDTEHLEVWSNVVKTLKQHHS